MYIYYLIDQLRREQVQEQEAWQKKPCLIIFITPALHIKNHV